MSAKLDMALDDVVMTERTTRLGRGRGGRGRGRRVANAARKAIAPAGGIQKTTKATKGPLKPVVPNGPRSGGGDSKVIPSDVTEKMVKDYFSDAIGPVKKVILSYGANGVMNGTVTIIFSRVDSATKALETLNGIKVDNRPMKIEVVLDASKAAAAVPTKGLSDRITAGVKGPKPATADKPATNGAATRGGRATRGRGRRGRNAGRAKPKTADELDAEMVDYFDPSNTNGAGNATAAANGTAQPAGDAGMDEIA
ncbi:MAG: hypothetical protein L6R41_005247 [Letrouitia leprolyta]|nr:MAG: hypothetical protein L6R41_005247 [Letrouitia leprolyta]